MSARACCRVAVNLFDGRVACQTAPCATCRFGSCVTSPRAPRDLGRCTEMATLRTVALRPGATPSLHEAAHRAGPLNVRWPVLPGCVRSRSSGAWRVPTADCWARHARALRTAHQLCAARPWQTFNPNHSLDPMRTESIDARTRVSPVASQFGEPGTASGRSAGSSSCGMLLARTRLFEALSDP